MTIHEAFSNHYFQSDSRYTESLSWDDIRLLIHRKKTILYGTGVLAEIAFFRLGKDALFERVVDNDPTKWDKPVFQMVNEAFEIDSNKQINKTDAISEYDPNDTLILIASVNYYDEIQSELERRGFHDHQILLFTELKALHEGEDEYDTIVRQISYSSKAVKKPIDKNKIVCRSLGSFSDHAKYITQGIAALSKDLDLDIVWVIDDINEDLPHYVRKIWARNWKQYIYEMETASIWIANTPIPEYVIKREGQIYINTKHWASITLKKFYLDSASLLQNNEERVRLWQYNAEMMDYIFSGSEFDEDSCRRGFSFNGEFVRVGSPRTDAMFDKEACREKVYSFYRLDSDVRTLLYAPTYRFQDNQNGDFSHILHNMDMDYKLVVDSLEERFGGEWRIVLRLHPSLKSYNIKSNISDQVIDASSYPDGEELCSACEAMISDYSSIMFESAFVKKPVFLYAPDKDTYIDGEYDLLINYDTLPFPIAETNEQLAVDIINFNQEQYEAEVTTFLDKYGVHEDGHASERAAEFILKLLGK